MARGYGDRYGGTGSVRSRAHRRVIALGAVVLLPLSTAAATSLSRRRPRPDPAAGDELGAGRRSAPVVGIRPPVSDVAKVLPPAGTAAGGRTPVVVGTVKQRVAQVSAMTSHDIPLAALDAYQHAAGLGRRLDPGCHLSWTLLAGHRPGGVRQRPVRRRRRARQRRHLAAHPRAGAQRHRRVGAIRDTDGGRYDGDPVWDRAVGPMQFIPGTWAGVRRRRQRRRHPRPQQHRRRGARRRALPLRRWRRPAGRRASCGPRSCATTTRSPTSTWCSAWPGPTPTARRPSSRTASRPADPARGQGADQRTGTAPTGTGHEAVRPGSGTGGRAARPGEVSGQRWHPAVAAAVAAPAVGVAGAAGRPAHDHRPGQADTGDGGPALRSRPARSGAHAAHTAHTAHDPDPPPTNPAPTSHADPTPRRSQPTHQARTPGPGRSRPACCRPARPAGASVTTPLDFGPDADLTLRQGDLNGDGKTWSLERELRSLRGLDDDCT